MAKVQEIRSYAGKSPDACFAVEDKAFISAGFQNFKKRDMAWLVQAHFTENNKKIEANLSARPGANTAVTLSLNCDAMSEAELKPFAEKVFAAFEEEIK